MHTHTWANVLMMFGSGFANTCNTLQVANARHLDHNDISIII